MNINSIPEGYSLDENGLPYKLNRQYGWGREFNTFVTDSGKHFHKSRCPKIKGKKKTLIHRYKAIKQGYTACPQCMPLNTIDSWYTQADSEIVMRVFDSNNETYDKVVNVSILPDNYDKYIDKDGYLYVYAEKLEKKIDYKILTKKQWKDKQ